MSRTFRILAIAACTLAIVGVASAWACDHAKQASAEKASTSSSCTANASAASAGSCAAKADMANAGNSSCSYACSASAMKACMAQANCPMGNGCCAKTAMALGNYEPFTFVKQADASKVAVGVSTTDNGFAFVFAGLTADDVVMAKKLAADGVASMNAPAHCAMTRGAMAEKAGGCEASHACLSALADAEIVLTETEQGAVASISSKDEAKVKELHALLASVVETSEPVEGSE